MGGGGSGDGIVVVVNEAMKQSRKKEKEEGNEEGKRRFELLGEVDAYHDLFFSLFLTSTSPGSLSDITKKKGCHRPLN